MVDQGSTPGTSQLMLSQSLVLMVLAPYCTVTESLISALGVMPLM